MAKTFRRRACAVIVHGELVLAVRLEDPASRALLATPPGGAVEPGERPAETARRETREETGYEVTIDAASGIVVRYDFVWDGQVFDCETHFFRGRLAQAWAEPPAVKDAAYHRGAFWLEKTAAAATFGFDAAVRDAILGLL